MFTWTVARQAPLSIGFSWQEYWSGLPFPSPGDLPHPGIEPRSPTLQADALTSAPPKGRGALPNNNLKHEALLIGWVIGCKKIVVREPAHTHMQYKKI